MSDRNSLRKESLADRRRSALSARRGPGRIRCRPAVEGLENRALMSYGGGLDFAYGIQGIVTPGVVVSDYKFTSVASAIEPDGKLVVVGAQQSIPVGSVGTYTEGFSARRYNADGSLDSTFANTNLFSVGNVTGSYNQFGQVGTPQYTGATGVALQSDGKILVVGDVNNTALVVRLNADGSFDTTFGTNGVVTLGTAGQNDPLLDYASAVATLPGGLIAVGGAVQAIPDGPDSPAVQVLNADGTIDNGYGSGGLAPIPLPANALLFANIAPRLPANATSYTPAGPVEMVAQSDGSVIIVANAVTTFNGLPSAEIVATRLTAAGVVDTSYGTAGQAILSNLTGGTVTPAGIAASAITLMPDGGLAIGGSILDSGDYNLVHEQVTKLTSSGQVDTAWGASGAIHYVTFPPTLGSYVAEMVVQPDGKLVLADGLQSDFSRLTADGKLDPTFGNGAVIYSSPTPVEGNTPGPGVGAGAVGVAITPLGKILATRSDSSFAQLLETGAQNDFNQDGLSDPAVYDTTTATFTFMASGVGTGVTIPYGAPGAGLTLPTPGAFSGFGVDELAVYLPTVGAFSIRPFYGTPYVAQPYGGSDILIPFGMPGVGNSIPAPGDYNGPSLTELGVYLPNAGFFVYRPSGSSSDASVPFGIKGAGQTIPTPGDYLGVGYDQIAAYLPSMGAFEIHTPNNTDTYITIGLAGIGNSIPVPGDYDGSGMTEAAVYEPSTAELIYQPASGGAQVTIHFGISVPARPCPSPATTTDRARPRWRRTSRPPASSPIARPTAARTSTSRSAPRTRRSPSRSTPGPSGEARPRRASRRSRWPVRRRFP